MKSNQLGKNTSFLFLIGFNLGGISVETKSIKILIVDDHEIIRYGMKMLIGKTDDMEVIGACGCLEEAYAILKIQEPDVILLDAKLPDGNGVSHCSAFKKLAPDSKIILLTAFVEEEIIINGVLTGIDGYLVKNTSKSNIIAAIEAVAAGQSYIDSNIANKVLYLFKQQYQRAQLLTDKDARIMDLICQGKTNKNIAKDMFLAEKTIRNRVSGIFKKLQVKNRTEAALCWTEYKNKTSGYKL